MRRLLTVTAIVALLLAACGDDGDDDTSDPSTTTSTTSTTSSTTTSTSTTTTTTSEVPADDGGDDLGDDGDDGDDGDEEPDDTAAEPVAVRLSEFSVTVDGEVTAGTTTFAVTNEGEFSHEFGVARGTSYAELPQLANGAIDEEALGDAVLGKSDVLDAGTSTEIDFDLEPGDYVLFCNINVGPNSHAANGQTLSISVG